MLFLIFCHRYEFEYIWKHLNDAMSPGLVLASFWGGQEGGFLLWMFWMLVLALVFLRRQPGKLEAPVMAIHAGVLTGLSSMLLGLWFGDFQFGLDPFLLLREAPQNHGLPWTLNPDYLSLIPQFADGQGLNPLLQNYWMVIHPPTLFLGFASTLMPFALARLWPVDARPPHMDGKGHSLGVLWRCHSRGWHPDGRRLGIRSPQFWWVLGLGSGREQFPGALARFGRRCALCC